MASELRTVNDIFFLAIGRDQSQMVRYRRGGAWVSTSSREFYARVAAVANALKEWGLRKGDRVAILSENRPEWAIADFACLALGVVDVPIYPTLTAEQAGYILRDSGARVAFVSTADQLRKVQSIQHATALERVAVMDDIAGSGAI